MGELAWQQIDGIPAMMGSHEPVRLGTRGRSWWPHRHCALSVARPPSEEATCRTTDQPLSMASRQSALLHWEVFHSEALAAFQPSVMDDAGR